jgi:hypothetical protein
MPAINVNMDEMRRSVEVPGDPGWYQVQVTDSRLVDNKNGQSHYCALYVTEGPTQEDGSDPAGRIFPCFHPLSDLSSYKDGGKMARGLYLDFMKAIGWDVEGEDPPETEDFMDKELQIHLKVRMNPESGKVENQVSGYRAL